MNLIGLTSSRNESRTNAYMARILLLDGNTFSSCVRSEKRILIVVYASQPSTHVSFGMSPPQKKKQRLGERKRGGAYIWPTIALHLCLLLTLRARQQRRIVQRDGASVELLLSDFDIGERGREVIIW